MRVELKVEFAAECKVDSARDAVMSEEPKR
jgi:hypothetical protein